MKPLEKIYWIRLVLGIVAALICTGYGTLSGGIPKVNPAELTPDQLNAIMFNISLFINSLSIALAVYLISYYLAIKRVFILKVEKPQKLATAGVGIYFIAWLVFWVFLYTIIAAT